MTLLALTPVRLNIGGSSPVNLTSALVPLSTNTGVTYSNSGHEALFVSVGSTATTATSKIGTTVEGQTPPGVSSGALPVSAISMLGPYPRDYDQSDGTVEVDFSSQTNVSVALVQMPGVT